MSAFFYVRKLLLGHLGYVSVDSILIPVKESFYVNNIIRLHFAKLDTTLYEALERLSHIKEKML